MLSRTKEKETNNMDSTGLGTQPSATTYELEDLIENAWLGKVRVPHFNRDFRWGTRDVIRLFDSISKGYPIGSLLLWVRKSPAQIIDLGRLHVEAPAFEDALWVVDGQQRITSLANALHPVGNKYSPFNVYYDLSEREFIQAPRTPQLQHIPLPVLFDLEQLLSWFAREKQIIPELFNEAQRIVKKLRQFKVPAYLVRQDDQRILTDIFDRMNNYGKRLSRAEVFSALFAGPETEPDSALTLSRIADRVAERTGFGTIDADTILSSILARRGPDPARDIHNEFDPSKRRESEFPDEDKDAAYHHGEDALVRAIDFLRTHAGVPHLALLAYRAPLVFLTRFFAHFPEPSQNTLRLLRRLYWRVAVSGPAVFKGSFTQVSRVLSARIKADDEHGSINALIDAMSGAPKGPPNAERFKTNEATTKIVLSAWWSRQPRSLVTGIPFDDQDLSTLLADQNSANIVAYRVFSNGLSPRENLLAANRLLLPTDSDPVSEISSLIMRQPANLSADTWRESLASHLIDDEMIDALKSGRGGAKTFLALRQAAVKDQLADFIDRMAEWDYEDTPTLDSMDLDEMEEVDGLFE